VWAPADSGTWPFLIYVGDERPELDTVLAGYLASHGFVVALLERGGAVGVAEALRMAARLPSVDAGHGAVARWGGGSRAAAMLDFDAEDSIPGVLVIQTADSASRPHLRVTLPRSTGRLDVAAARRYRLLCVVTHIILNAVLRGDQTLTVLAARLKAAGVTTEIDPAP
jgi:hypothetical protein